VKPVAFFESFTVVYACHEYDVECLVTPPREAPHAGADSPRYLDPGTPLQVEVIRILEGRIDIGIGLSPECRAAIESLVELAAVAKHANGSRAASIVRYRPRVNQMELGL
jgi:hypothetical protein